METALISICMTLSKHLLRPIEVALKHKHVHIRHLSSLASVRLWRWWIALWSGSLGTSVVVVLLDPWVTVLVTNITDKDCTILGTLATSCQVFSLFSIITSNVGCLPPLLLLCLQDGRSAAVFADWTTLIHESLYLRRKRSCYYFLSSSWPYNRSFGRRHFSMHHTWCSSHRRRRRPSIAMMVYDFVLLRTFVQVRPKNLMWNALSFFSCLASAAHSSLPYSRVLIYSVLVKP